MKLDQSIYRLILDHNKGIRADIKGTNETTLTQMSKGKSNLRISTIKKMLIDNGMSGEITIYGAGTKTTINFFD